MIKSLFKLIFKLIGWFLLLSILLVVVYKWAPVPATPLMGIRYFENPDEAVRHDWVSLKNISPNLQLAVVASEDQNFLYHDGFDYKAIQKALDEKRKQTRGASTISQQTAKNVFLWPNRSWVRKGLEVYFTFLIEQLWSKERILEVYLNSIEMGKGIYGAEAASKIWFGKSAARLTSYEAAAIAAILPNPRVYRANPPSNYIQQRKNWIVQQMQNLGQLKF